MSYKALLPGFMASRARSKDEYMLKFVGTVVNQNLLTIFIFFRGWWCPACRQHLKQIESIRNQLYDKGVGVVAISSQSERNGSIFGRLKEKDVVVKFPIISDPSSLLAKQLLPKHSNYTLPTPTVLDKKMYDGKPFIGYVGQQPALLIIDKKRSLRFCWSMKNDLPPGTGHTKETFTRGTVGDPWIRPKPLSILKTVDSILQHENNANLVLETVDLFPR